MTTSAPPATSEKSAAPVNATTAPVGSPLAEKLQDVQVARRTDLKFSRHVHADGVAYVVHHPVTFQSHRLTSDDYHVFSFLDGKRPLKRVFENLVKADILDAGQEDDFYRYIVHLNAIGLLNLPITDGKQLHQRFQQRRENEKKGGINRYLFYRIPLFQPDAFLNRTIRFVRPMFTRAAVVVWAVCLVACFAMIWKRWDAFTSPLAGMSAAGNLLVMWGLLIGLKVVHEFGHAWACKHFGGHVPEMGAYMMMGSPCAYMDASASWSFPRRLQRIAVALGGMYFESWVAMAAVLVWCMTGPSLLNSAAHMIVVLSSVVTLAFNMNPLMKYDGYFALSDLLGLPHMREDASAELKRISKKMLFGLDQPTVAQSFFGQAGYIAFGIATALYRVVIVLGISYTLSTFIPGAGTLIIISCVGGFLFKSTQATIRYLQTSDELADRRQRAVLVTGCLAVFVLMAGVLMPVPGGQQAVAVIAPSQQHVLYATEPGFLESTYVSNGDAIACGDAVCRLRNPNLNARLQADQLAIDSRSTEIAAQLAGTKPRSRNADNNNLRHSRAAVAQQRLNQSIEDYVQTNDRQDRLEINSPADGTVTLADGIQITGRYVKPGEQLAVINSGGWEVHAVMNEEILADWKPQLGDQVKVCLRGSGRTFVAYVNAVERTGSTRIKRRQLWQTSGGSIAVIPETGEAQQSFFEIRAAILNATPEDESALRDGTMAYVKLGAPRGTMGTLLFRNVLRFLSQQR